MSSRNGPAGQDGRLQRCVHNAIARMFTGMTDTVSAETRPAPTSGAWMRVFALVYDSFLWVSEIAGMRTRRADLLARARGRVVEIGAGTGLNIAHYRDEIAELRRELRDAS